MAELALAAPAQATPAPAWRRSLTIGLIGFLTLVDLFATQAILPSLATTYGVTPTEIGIAANASTIGLAIAGLLTGALAGRLDRRLGIWLSLALLAIPTFLLASAPDLASFALLRVIQGLFMASAFTLTLAYLGERCSTEDAAGALAAYVTGGVASNLIGRLCAATVAS
ncbi:MAG: MFS transporter [Sphingosinicella sp.]|uniref:MFS transporter n=1 Tax=Sphingosinicella sp. TaxID=1917971 RepID=UPI004037E45F